MSKKPIPPNLRTQVWFKFFNSNEGMCYCCKNKINMNSYHCGHIISEYNGGLTSLENLIPICKSCNSSMGVMNLYEYKEKFYSSDDDPGTFGQQFIHSLINDIYQSYFSKLNSNEKLKLMKELLNNAIDEKMKEL